MSDLQTPVAENLLLAAYRSVKDGEQKAPDVLAAEYERHFSTVVPANSHTVFERFSLSDSTVRVILKSDTISA